MGVSCSAPLERILLLGTEKSGKTTLFYYLKLKRFQKVIPTIGFNEEEIQFNRMNLEVMDLSEENMLDQGLSKYDNILYLIDPQGDKDDQEEYINKIKNLENKNIIYAVTKGDLCKADSEKIIQQYNLQLNQNWRKYLLSIVNVQQQKMKFLSDSRFIKNIFQSMRKVKYFVIQNKIYFINPNYFLFILQLIQISKLLETLKPTLNEFQARFDSIQKFIDKSNESLPKIRQKVQNKQQSNNKLLTDKILQSCNSIKDQINSNIQECKNAQALLQKFDQAIQSNPIENARDAQLQIEKLEKDSVVLIENLQVVTDLINNILFVINNKSGVQQIQQPQPQIQQQHQQEEQIQSPVIQSLQQSQQMNGSVVTKYESIIEQLSNENTKLQQKINQQQIEIIQLRTTQTQDKELTQSRMELNQEVQSLSLQLQQEIKQNKKYNEQINSLVQQLSQSKQEQEERIADLQNANNNYKAQLQHVSQEIEESIAQISELSSQNQKLNADVIQLNKDCQMYQQQINELQQVIEKQNEQLRDLKQLQFEQRIQQQTNQFNNQLIQQVQPQQQTYQSQIPTLYNSRATFSYKPEQLNFYQQNQSQLKQTQAQNNQNPDMKELLKTMKQTLMQLTKQQ